jgi:L-iditol 2-dehydrogenase
VSTALPETMRGAMLLGPEQIEIRDVPVPRTGDGEVLLKIEAATTCGTDVKVFRRGGHPRMLKAPTLFGHEMAGIVAKTGPNVTGVKEGDAIVVGNSAPCMQCEPCRRGRENLCEDLHYLNGAFAEYLLVPKRFVERNVHRIPPGLSFERAALAEPLACVLHGIDALELPRYTALGPVEVLIFGGGPIGLLFVAALARMGQKPVLADPNASRLDAGRALGAARTIEIARGGGQAEVARRETEGGKGYWIAVDCTGQPGVWSDAIESLRPGGLVNLFGGCAPGTSIPLDTHLVHYSELTLKGVYHHRPDTFRRALELLADPAFNADLLITGARSIEGVVDALRSMMRKETLKVAIRPDL